MIWGEGPEGPSKIYMLLRMHSFAAILQSYKRLVDKFIVYTLIYFTFHFTSSFYFTRMKSDTYFKFYFRN